MLPKYWEDVNPRDLALVDKVTGEVKYRDLEFRYPSRQAERLVHKRWKKKGWSDAKIAEFEALFQIKRVQ